MTDFSYKDIKSLVTHGESFTLEAGPNKKNENGEKKATIAKQSFYGRLCTVFYLVTGRPNPVREAFSKLITKDGYREALCASGFDFKSYKNISSTELMQAFSTIKKFKEDTKNLEEAKVAGGLLEDNFHNSISTFENIQKYLWTDTALNINTFSQNAIKGIKILNENIPKNNNNQRHNFKNTRKLQLLRANDEKINALSTNLRINPPNSEHHSKYQLMAATNFYAEIIEKYANKYDGNDLVNILNSITLDKSDLDPVNNIRNREKLTSRDQCPNHLTPNYWSDSFLFKKIDQAIEKQNSVVKAATAQVQETDDQHSSESPQNNSLSATATNDPITLENPIESKILAYTSKGQNQTAQRNTTNPGQENFPARKFTPTPTPTPTPTLKPTNGERTWAQVASQKP